MQRNSNPKNQRGGRTQSGNLPPDPPARPCGFLPPEFRHQQRFHTRRRPAIPLLHSKRAQRKIERFHIRHPPRTPAAPFRMRQSAPPERESIRAGAVEIVKESEGSIEEFCPTSSRLYVNDLLGGPSRVRVFDLAGKRLADLPVPPISSVDGMVAVEGDDLLIEIGSYLELPAWLRFSAAGGACRKTALLQTSIVDYSDTEVIREYARSKDGTMVPLDILRRKSARLDGANPTILYGYGGYGVSMTPKFSASRRIWLDQGGVFVLAILRGGGEFGDEWHLAGNLQRKQNVFDDFYACAEWLVEHKYTSPAKLAIFGESNGGLLMGAALTEHPEYYRAVVSRVGIYDSLRAETTTNGRFNVTEYGSVNDPEQFKALYAYSPYHHVVDGVKYPSILLTTGANDPRVDPWHSRKFCARLQAASASGNPILLRTSKTSGHGMGNSLDETIAERTDIFAFLIHELGVEFRPAM